MESRKMVLKNLFTGQQWKILLIYLFIWLCQVLVVALRILHLHCTV